MTTPITIVDNTSQDELRLRDATMADLDGIALLAQTAFPDDPERDYRFPYREEYPEDNWKWTRREYEVYLEQPEKYHIIVVEALSHLDTVSTTIVALCVWDVRHLNGHHELTTPSILGEEQRKDANILHMTRFNEVFGELYTKYFLQYGDCQLHLANLATHPNYRRRGCGAALCKWGMEKAKERHWVVSVFASPMGRLLYMAQGFEELGIEPLYVPGETEKLQISSLLYCTQ